MTLYIKDMVCVRCKMAVQAVLRELNIPYQKVELGFVTLAQTLSDEQLFVVDQALRLYELELMDDKRKILVERIKTLIIEAFRSSNNPVKLKFSEYLSKSLFHDYTYLANVFSEVEGSTIEKFYIEARVERVKELLVYENMSLKEIAYSLNYSSVSHLGLQFKKITGKTPLAFKKLCESGNYIWREI